MNRRATKRLSGLVAWVAASAVVLSMAIAVPATADAGDPAAETLPSSVHLTGALRVVPVEPDPDDHEVALSDEKLVTLVTDDGARVELSGDAVAGAVSGDRFDGTVVVTDEVEEAVIEAAGPEPLPTDEVALGELVAEAGAELETALEVADADLTPIVENAVAAKAHTIDVMYARPSGGPTPSTAAIDAHIARLSSFWATQTNGQIPSITRPLPIRFVTLPASEVCNAGGMWDYAAGPSGFNRTGEYPGDPSSYYWGSTRSAHLAVIVPGDLCGMGSGLGTVGTIHSGGTVWSSVDADPARWDNVQFHEVGHNVGLGHSNLTVCDEPVVDAAASSSTCEQHVYRDYYDVMGGGYRTGAYDNTSNIGALNVTHKAYLDALPRTGTTPALRRVQTSGGLEQRFTLAPAGGTTGTRGLEVIDPVNGDRLYVEYRSGTGLDAQSFYSRISADPTHDERATYAPGVRVLKFGCVIPATCQGPGSTVLRRWAGPDQAVLSHGVGDSFTSYTRSAGYPAVRISVVSADAAGAVVDVSFDSSLATFNSPTASISGTPRYFRVLSAAVSPAWTPTPTTTTYRWLRGGAPIAGATGATYRVQSADVSAAISVRVTVKAPGYATKSITSPAVTVQSGLDRYSLAGTVQRGAGVPLSALTGMRVEAHPIADPPGLPNYVGLADVDASTGAYRFADLPAGEWTLKVAPQTGADVGTRWYGNTPFEADADTIVLDAARTGVNIATVPSPRIRGVLSAPPGTPAATARYWLSTITVTATPEGSSSPNSWPRAAEATLNPDTGAYALIGLDPGSYSLQFQALPEWGEPAVPIARQYWQSALAWADRTPITVVEADVTGIDQVLIRTRSIVGNIQLPGGFNTAWTSYIGVEARDADGTLVSAPMATGGSFRIDGLNPGLYTVCTTISDYDWIESQGAYGYVTGLVPSCATSAVDVRGGDATGIQIIAQAGRSASGTVTFPAGTAAALRANAWVGAYRVLASGVVDEQNMVSSAEVDATTGAYRLDRLTPGRYAVRVSPLEWWDGAPTGFGLTWRGGTASAASSQFIDVTAGSVSAVNVSLVRQTAGLSGTIPATGVPGGNVYLRTLQLVDATGTDVVAEINLYSTSYAFSGILPGTYRLLYTLDFMRNDGSGSGRQQQYLTSPAGTKLFTLGATPVTGVALTPGAAAASLAGSITTAGFGTAGGTLATAVLYERDGATWVRHPGSIAQAFGNETERFTGPLLPAGTYTLGYLATPDAYVSTTAGVVQEWWSDRASLAAADAVTLTGDQVRSSLHGAVHPVGVIPPLVLDPPITATDPTLSGVARVGSTLTAVTDGWTNGATFTYQWLLDGAPIAGATASTALMRTAYLGKAVSVTVTGSAAGRVPATRTSAGLTVEPGIITAATPRIVGTPKAGLTLTVSRGTWTSGVAFTYQWYVSGKAVAGATKTTFIPTAAHIGKTVRVKVTGTRAGFTTVAKASDASKPVAAYSILKKSTPTISGTRAVGSTLTAKPGTWTAGTTFSYQWYRNGVAIKGATAVKYKLTSTDRGKRMTVRVGGKKPGYLSASALSAPTATIK